MLLITRRAKTKQNTPQNETNPQKTNKQTPKKRSQNQITMTIKTTTPFRFGNIFLYVGIDVKSPHTVFIKVALAEGGIFFP